MKTKVQILHFLQPRKVQKSPQVVKHVVKGEKWACSTLKAGKNKPMFICCEHARFQENLRENKRKTRVRYEPSFWSE